MTINNNRLFDWKRRIKRVELLTMAMRTTTNSKKICVKCDKSTGAFTCDGCQQSFCLKHVAEHRQELTHRMDLLEQDHDVFNEHLTNQMTKYSEHPIFDLINRWQRESIEKIEQVAQQSREDMEKIFLNIHEQGKKTLNRMSWKFHRARQTEDFFEKDLQRWTQQLTHLQEEIQCTINTINIIPDQSTPVLPMIKITLDNPVDQGEADWPAALTWFSGVKALFSHPTVKSFAEKNEQTDSHPVQTFNTGPLSIARVNHSDRYIDLENDSPIALDQNMTGWTLRREIDHKPSKIIYQFPENYIFSSPSNLRIYCGKPTDLEDKARQVLVNENDEETWDFGCNIVTSLVDPNGEEKASIIQTFAPL